MSSVLPFQKHFSKPLFIWVLAPQLETGDANLDYYYDFSQSIAEYARVFTEMRLEWRWQPVSIHNYETIINQIEQDRGSHTPVVFNLCDGDETNGAPGISVIRLLQQKGLIYTGADEYFYHITTSKIDMKKAFDLAHVSTPPWVEVNQTGNDLPAIFATLGSPLIVKPAVSGGSLGVGIRSVVHNEAQLQEQIDMLFKGYRGWNTSAGGVIVESFINGPEFTSFIVGSHDQPGSCHIYPAVQRRFHSSLPEMEQFLSFDRLWEIYEEESSMPNEENFYEYEAHNPLLTEELKKLGWQAYQATGGTGYTRIDFRQDKKSGKLFVLEVNAQCGLSEDENFTSIGAILRLANQSFSKLIEEIIDEAFLKHKSSLPPVKTKPKYNPARSGVIVVTNEKPA